MNHLRSQIHHRTGLIELDRPQAINALSSAMIDSLTQLLLAWADDPGVDQVVVRGRGRGFCAGADVRELRQLVIDGQSEQAVGFLAREYRLNRLIATYPKPYIACLHGIAMGGGLGVSIHGSRRLVTAEARLAMPETIIGLWPDVGLTHHLSRLPGQIGAFMALTGLAVSGRQAVRAGLADALVPDALLTAPDEDAPGAVAALLEAALAPPEPTAPGARLGLGPEDAWMATAFAGDDLLAVVARLEASDLAPARQVAEAIRRRSPLSVAVSFQALRRAAGLDLDQVLAQDLRLGAFFLTQPDFAEGVRAQLVDKDFQPRWSHPGLEAVTAAEVDAAFAD